jgi:hypothetical protein
MQKANSKNISGQPERAARGRHPFVNAIRWFGVALVCVVLLWTFSMVILQAVEQWKR